jgi:hypothetical protein
LADAISDVELQGEEVDLDHTQTKLKKGGKKKLSTIKSALQRVPSKQPSTLIKSTPVVKKVAQVQKKKVA